MMRNEEKFRKNMNCLDKWLSNYEQDKRIAIYLKARQIQRVGVYGYGILGKHLVRELRQQNFPISWVMDRKAAGDEISGTLMRPDEMDRLEDVDIAVITTLADLEEVENSLLRYLTGEIISVEELIEAIYVWREEG